jgi:hypothetical protein
MRINHIYATAMLAVPVAVTAILATAPTASPANDQINFRAIQNAPLDPPCDVNLNWGNCDFNVPDVNVPDVNVPNVNVPNVNLPNVNVPYIGR